MLTGPFTGQVIPVLDHEIASLIDTGQAELLGLEVSPPEIVAETPAPEVAAEEAAAPTDPVAPPRKRAR